MKSKICALILMIFLTYNLYAQTEVYKYYDDTDGEVEKHLANYYSIVKTNEEGNWHGVIKSFYMDNTLRSICNYKNGDRDGEYVFYNENGVKISSVIYEKNRIKGSGNWWHPNGQKSKQAINRKNENSPLDVNFQVISAWDTLGNISVENGNGYFKEYFDSDQIRSEGKYYLGDKDAVWTGYHESGEKYYVEHYRKGQIIEGTSYDIEGNQYTYQVESVSAKPKRGYASFYKYVQNNLKYPKSARKARIEGRVFVEFIVNKDASVSDVKILKGIHPECDQLAYTAVKNFQKWMPGKERGQVEKQRIVLPITFKL